MLPNGLPTLGSGPCTQNRRWEWQSAIYRCGSFNPPQKKMECEAKIVIKSVAAVGNEYRLRDVKVTSL